MVLCIKMHRMDQVLSRHTGSTSCNATLSHVAHRACTTSCLIILGGAIVHTFDVEEVVDRCMVPSLPPACGTCRAKDRGTVKRASATMPRITRSCLVVNAEKMVSG